MLEVVKCYKRLKWKICLIPRVEILKIASKMASEMATSKAYLTNKLDKKHSILTFYTPFLIFLMNINQIIQNEAQ